MAPPPGSFGVIVGPAIAMKRTGAALAPNVVGDIPSSARLNAGGVAGAVSPLVTRSVVIARLCR